MMKLPRARSIVFGGIVLVGVYAAIEALAFVALLRLDGDFSLDRYQHRRDGITRVPTSGEPREANQRGYTKVVHPFLGYVLHPDSRYHDYEVGFNAFGFAGREDPLAAAPGEYVVAITGGSVALRLFIDARDQLAEGFAALVDQPVRVICLANAGYKQPQQLNAVTWHLSLGGRIDALINLDGFNETVKARRRATSYPAFPNLWRKLLLSVQEPDEMLMVGRIALLQSRRLRAAELAAALRYSPLANFLWSVADRDLESRIAAEQSELAAFEGAYSYLRHGPDLAVADRARFVADLWQRSSRLLDGIARANSFRYYHFLQPNQYLRGSKPLTPLEREKRLRVERNFERVAVGYELLRRRGEALVAEGVHFSDLTAVFAATEDTVYIDDCCHVNANGSAIMARAILAAVEKAGAGRGGDGDRR